MTTILKTMNRKLQWMLMAGLMAWAGAVMADRPYVVLLDGTRVEGTDIRARATGEIILTEPRGTRTFMPGQYDRAYAPRPSEFDEAQRMVNERRFEQAIPILEEIIRRMRHLEWDNRAMDLMARAQMGMNEHDAAVRTYERLFQQTPRMRDNPEVLWSYYRSMLGAEQFDRLETEMERIIREGSRADAGRAQILRGDIKQARNLYEDAVLDYMRTVVFFSAQRDLQPEALYKTGEALERLRDDRARGMFERVVREYPQSRYAEMARRKL